MGNGKGKVHPIACHEGAEEMWRYSFSLSLTSALDVAAWLTPHHGRSTRDSGEVCVV